MELRQLRYFVRVVEYGSMGRAAAELGVVTSALSQQISRLESELSTRLLRRTSSGVVPTDAGLAFWRQAQLALRRAGGAGSASFRARQRRARAEYDGGSRATVHPGHARALSGGAAAHGRKPLRSSGLDARRAPDRPRNPVSGRTGAALEQSAAAGRAVVREDRKST